ncbi:helix-turn-helix domain-containing protein [Domibacillus indicus]|uniref:helix-turn-helix domain-containing protein n=1 Tax=Domibacillus indicus TaxID=1437523 RepID=UPI00203D216C|nr:helix-turn-helix domain-containing protein [Domibacillus indicus]MCM3788432.1 helix-turn-helix domain-containing protein [Domibacillus indicus]
MNELTIGLACAGAFFILLSFFLPDKQRQLEKEIEELSMKMLQEHYQFNKKLKVLEEELLIGETPAVHTKKPAAAVNKIIQSQVIALYQQGTPIAQIAAQSSLSTEQVKSILDENMQTESSSI